MIWTVTPSLIISLVLYAILGMKLDVDSLCDYPSILFGLETAIRHFFALEDYKPEQKSTVEYAYSCKFYGIESELAAVGILNRDVYKRQQ